MCVSLNLILLLYGIFAPFDFEIEEWQWKEELAVAEINILFGC